MSISAITMSTATQAADNSAKAQLQRDEQKLVADTKAKANQAQLAADTAAIALDQIAVAQGASTRVDIYL
jgi:hypothetical protein